MNLEMVDARLVQPGDDMVFRGAVRQVDRIQAMPDGSHAITFADSRQALVGPGIQVRAGLKGE